MRVTARQWLTDWRSVLMIVVAVLVGLLVVLVVTSITDRENALQVAKRATANEQAERTVLNHRVDQLLAQIDLLETDAQGDSAQLAVLRREVELLQQQVRDMGGQPVVIGAGGGMSPSPQPQSSSRSASPRPSPTRTSPHPSPSRSKVCVLVVCA